MTNRINRRVLSAVLALAMAVCLPLAATASATPVTLDISKGSITFDSGSVSGKDSGGNDVTSTAANGVIIEQSAVPTANTVRVLSGTGYNVTLSGVNIDTSGASGEAFDIASGASVNLTLSGDNTLKSAATSAGLRVPEGAAVKISGSGSLTAESDAAGITYNGAAGIGGSGQEIGGIIDIEGGTIIARGGAGGGAGIGGGAVCSGGNITISGGAITAIGGNNGYGAFGGAGIGGGGGGDGGNITISGGIITEARGGDDDGGAGIGGGSNGNGGTISISGGRIIKAQGGADGAGIGGGDGGGGGTISISGSAIITLAKGGKNGAGIGGGDGGDGGNISIFGGAHIQEATGGAGGAGIGGGNGDDCGTISISGGMVQGANGGTNGAGIGCGNGGYGGTINITDGSIAAQGGESGAGIGGGNGSDGCEINISGGSITALGGTGGAGIGGGNGSNGVEINISGSTINEAIGGAGGAGIGGGINGHPGNIAISGGIIQSVQGGTDGAGIGCGKGGSEGTVEISGGTIKKAEGNGVGADIGGGSVKITSGNIYAANNKILPAPKNGSDEVYRVELTLVEADGVTPIGNDILVRRLNRGTIDGFKDVKTLDGGKLYFYLRENDDIFEVNTIGSLNAHSQEDVYSTGDEWITVTSDGTTSGTLKLSGAPIEIPFGDVIEYDIAKGEVVFEDGGVVGYGPDGYKVGTPSLGHKEVFIRQSNSYTPTANTVKVTDGDGAPDEYNVRLWNVNINSATDAAFDIAGGATVNLTLDCEVTLKGGATFAGLNVPQGATVNIEAKTDDNDSLSVTGGNGGGAGIGGKNGESGGTINIKSGTVSATGGNGDSNSPGGAGIGGGANGAGGTINISGGRIAKAQGGNLGAGIGGGGNGAGGAITISGGTIAEAEGGGTGAADIGAGGGESGGSVTIIGGNVCAASNTITPAPKNGTSGGSVPVYRVALTLKDMSGAAVSAGELVKSFVNQPGYTYGLTDVETLSGGLLYFYLPQDLEITSLMTKTAAGEDKTIFENTGDPIKVKSDNTSAGELGSAVTANPTASVTTIAKTAATQASVVFNLTNDPAYADGLTWKVYAAETGDTLVTGVTAANTGNSLTLSHATDVPANDYWVTATEGIKAESAARLKLTVGEYVAPFVTLGTDKTVTVSFTYAAASTDTQTDAIDIVTDAGTDTSVTFPYTDFSLSSSSTISDTSTAIAGASVTEISSASAGSVTLTVQLTKSLDASVTSAHLWYKSSYLGEISISKTVAAASTDATLATLGYKLGSADPIMMSDEQLEAAAGNGASVVLPYGTPLTAQITITATTTDTKATIISNSGVTLANGEGSAVVTVQAEDTTSQSKSYTINFTTEQKTDTPVFAAGGSTCTQSSASDATAEFTLSASAEIGTEYKVYSDAAGTQSAGAVSPDGTTLEVSLNSANTPITSAKTFYISAKDSDKLESGLAAVTINPYVAPSVTLGADTTVTVSFEYGDANTAVKDNTIQITTSTGTDAGVTFAAGDFSLLNGSAASAAAITGASVTGIGGESAGSTTLTVQIAKSATADKAYLWYKSSCVGEITISKTVAAAGTDAALTELYYSVGGGAAVKLDDAQLTAAAASAGASIMLPYGTLPTASIALTCTRSDDKATVSGGSAALSGGSISVTLTVTAEDGATTREYKINFTTQGRSAAPEFTSTADTLTAADDVTATFTLTNAVTGGAYSVYSAPTGGSALQSMLNVNGSTVTMTLGAAPTAEVKYYISVQSGSDAESTRTELTISPYVAPVITFSTQPTDTSAVVGRISKSLTAAAGISQSIAATLNWYGCDANGSTLQDMQCTGGTFAIPASLTVGDYYYICRATYAGAATVDSRVAKVSVTEAPPLGIGITPSNTIGQGTSDETLVTIGAGVDDFDIDNFDDIRGVQMSYENGPFIKLTQGDECDVTTGSIKVTLHRAYLDSLAAGRYTLRVNLKGAGFPSHVDTLLLITKNAPPPQTGDSASPWLWLLLCLLGAAGIVAGLKKKHRT